MPELPEVETTRRGLAPHLTGVRIASVTLRRADLRWPIAEEIATLLPGQRIDAVRRRAKYLLLDTAAGSALLHLGMSGSLRVLPGDTPLRAHDHVDVVLADGDDLGARGGKGVDVSDSRGDRIGTSDVAAVVTGNASRPDVAITASRVLRFNDPRRFGCLLWQAPGTTHPLLRGLGPEPLPELTMAAPGDAVFSGDYLFALSRGRKVAVKSFLMDQRVVVGVGNIYVAEALFAAGVSPLRAAGRVSRERYGLIADAIQRILTHAITRGGTTLRDFLSPDGAPGYFEQELSAYGRGGQACPRCGRPLKSALLGQRATVWCGHCQR